MTLTQLLTLVADWVDDPNFEYFTQPNLTTRLNLAVKELHKLLCDANEDYYTKSVKTMMVASQQHYSLPSDFAKIQLLEIVVSGTGVIADTQPLIPIPRIEKYSMSAQTAMPQGYFLNEDYLIIMPPPDSAYEMRLDYSRTVVEMQSGSDEPDAPDKYHEYPAVVVANDCLIKDSRPSAFLKAKKDEYAEMIRSDAEQRSQDYPRTVVRSYLNGFE